jgi:hypothetical protein
MNQVNITILEEQRPRVQKFFNTGSLRIAVGMSPCEDCIDGNALVRVMREEWEPSAELDPFANWNTPEGYKGFLSRLYAHYDAFQAKNNPPNETEGFNTIQKQHC